MPPPPAPPGAFALQAAPAYEREPPFAVDVMLGQEAGIRAQAALFPGRGEAFVVEGFYGMLFHNLGSSHALGAGGRYLFRETWPDGWNSVMLGPGVDVFFQLNRDSLILLTPSIDLAWVHKLGPAVQFELGLDAGLGIGVAGHTRSGNSGLGEVTTLISLFTGLRF